MEEQSKAAKAQLSEAKGHAAAAGAAGGGGGGGGGGGAAAAEDGQGTIVELAERVEKLAKAHAVIESIVQRQSTIKSLIQHPSKAYVAKQAELRDVTTRLGMLGT